MKWIGLVAAVGFVASVWLANYAVAHWGVVPVGFGLEAPAGVYLVGIAFTLRDITHRYMGRTVVIGCILAGAGLAWLIEANADLGGPVTLAVASAIAFLLSELADLAVFERIGGWTPAVIASNLVAILVDSALFLWLAFGSLAFFWGQAVGKAWMTALAIPLVLLLRRLPAKGSHAALAVR